MENNYRAGDIQVLEGLDAVRMRPGMYIGSTDARGLHHLLWEIVDNAIDEVANHYADTVTVTLNKDGSASVEDNGRGLPVDEHPVLHVSGVEVVYTQLHAGGKFSDKNYAYSGGLHGVGASVVNALSKCVLVDVFRDGVHYSQKFSSFKEEKTNKWQIGKPVTPLIAEGTTRKHGTKVTFWPDETVFDTVEFQHELILRRLRELAYLNRGASISFVDEHLKGEDRKQTFSYSGGIVDYVLYLNKEKDSLYAPPVYFQMEKDGLLFACAFQHTDSYTESLCSFVNNIPTPEGGSHEAGFRSAFTKVLNDYSRKMGFLKEKDQNLNGEDFREGLTAVLTVYMKNPQFEGQTKGRLGNSEVRPLVEQMTVDALSLFLDDLKTRAIGEKIFVKAQSAAHARLAARKAKDVARARSTLEAAPLVGKLSSCTGRKAEENELFIVEGDSAGGSAKQGRDRRFQAILPLRGKPLNVEKKRLEEVLENAEFRSIITALGTGIAQDFSLSHLKYHKVIILSDADQDGAHIRAILLTFFFRYMRSLLTEGHVYIGMPPLYLVKKGTFSEYVYDDKALPGAIKRAGRGYTIQRYKGLGEMNPEQLWETTMNRESRTLMQVTLEDAAEAEHMVSLLMGEKVDPRRAFISQNADFAKVDTFEGRVM